MSEPNETPPPPDKNLAARKVSIGKEPADRERRNKTVELDDTSATPKSRQAVIREGQAKLARRRQSLKKRLDDAQAKLGPIFQDAGKAAETVVPPPDNGDKDVHAPNGRPGAAPDARKGPPNASKASEPGGTAATGARQTTELAESSAASATNVQEPVVPHHPAVDGKTFRMAMEDSDESSNNDESGDADDVDPGDQNQPIPKLLSSLFSCGGPLLPNECEDFFKKMIADLQSYQDAASYLLNNTNHSQVQEFWNVVMGGSDDEAPLATLVHFVMQSSLPAYDVSVSFAKPNKSASNFERMCACIINLIRALRHNNAMVGNLLDHLGQVDDNQQPFHKETFGLPFSREAVWKFHGFKGSRGRKLFDECVCVATQLKVLRCANEYLGEQRAKHPDKVASKEHASSKFRIEARMKFFGHIAPANSVKAKLLEDPATYTLPDPNVVCAALNSWLSTEADIREIIGNSKLDHTLLEGIALRNFFGLHRVPADEQRLQEPPAVQLEKFLPPSITEAEYSRIVVGLNAIFSPDLVEEILDYIKRKWKFAKSANEGNGAHYRFALNGDAEAVFKLGTNKVVKSTKADALSKYLIALGNKLVTIIHDKTNVAMEAMATSSN